MIHSHLYARQPETPVFESPSEEGHPIHILHQGDWLGVLGRQDAWIHVIGIECEGWVKAGDVEERPPFSLHINLAPGKPIEYVSVL